MHHAVETKPFCFSANLKKFTQIFMVIGLVGIAVDFYLDPKHAWMDLLINIAYFLCLGISGGLFLAIAELTNARWSEALRKIPDAITAFLPVIGVMSFILFLGMPELYHWAHHGATLHDPILAGKAAYLNVPFFIARVVAVVGVFTLITFLMRRNNARFDQSGDFNFKRKNTLMAVLFLAFFAIGFSVLSFDLLMSLSPHWYSTIYTVYNFSGTFVNGIVAITLIAIILTQNKNLPLNENHFHDLGKLIFAFTLFWAYIWFSQFMLIWYGNIPEETVYFVARLKNDWDWLFFLNFAINFVVPFFVLLPRASKRSPALLMRVCILLLVGRWLDLYMMIAPNVYPGGASIGLLEIAVSLGFAGLFIHVVAKKFAANQEVAHSPILVESLNYHQ